MSNTQSKTVSMLARKKEAHSGTPSLQKKILYLFPLVLQTLSWIPTRLILKFFLHLKIRGLENLEGLKGPVIFAVNHSSEIDAVVLPASLPLLSRFFPHFSLFREEKFYNDLGLHARLFYRPFLLKVIGGVQLYCGKKNYERSLRNAIKLITGTRRASVCIFPEGRMTLTGKLQPAH